MAYFKEQIKTISERCVLSYGDVPCRVPAVDEPKEQRCEDSHKNFIMTIIV